MVRMPSSLDDHIVRTTDQEVKRSCCGCWVHLGINASGLNEANAKQWFRSLLLKKLGLPVAALKSADE
jgi:hypothetical protein